MKVTLDAVSFAYRGGPTILERFTAEFEAGVTYGVSGPSGRGKSTLLYLLGLLVRPEAGSVRYDGVDVGRLPDANRARLRGRSVGFVFQDALLDPARTVMGSVLEPCLFGGRSRRQASDEARSLLAALGVTVPLDRRPGQISGGQAQRVALCRALLHQPAVVLADEPTGNLDTATTHVVLQHLLAVARRGAVCVIASHDRAVLDRCDTVVAL